MQVNDTEKKIGIGVGVLTLIAIIWGFIGSVREQAYQEGRASLQQEINTLAKEALQVRIDQLQEEFEKDLASLKEKEEAKHKELEAKIEKGDIAQANALEDLKEFVLAEVAGNRADWNTAFQHLREIIEFHHQ